MPSWLASFRKCRQKRGALNNPGPFRVALLGIGNPDNGDDAAGGAAIRALSPLLEGQDHVLTLDTGLAPENFTGPVRRFRPDLVLLIDAAQMDEPPGAIRWLDWTETDGLAASTHTLSPYLLGEYLSRELGCAVAMLGIQPADNTPGEPLSPAVEAAVATLAADLAALLAE